MLFRIITLLFLLAISIGLFAGNDPTNRRIEKRVHKIWKDHGIRLTTLPDRMGSDPEGKFQSIMSADEILGFIYKGKVFTCGPDGCEKPDQLSDSREYFQFFVILNAKGIILYTEITEYAATHGHEVGSAGWLKQFRGKSADSDFGYGQEIDAITGATKSGQNLTAEIILVLNNFKKAAISKIPDL
jgi:hypothetical protein